MPMNMSYCRFENTRKALQECADWLGEEGDLDPFEKLSSKEKKAAKRLLELCADLAADYGDAE